MGFHIKKMIDHLDSTYLSTICVLWIDQTFVLFEETFANGVRILEHRVNGKSDYLRKKEMGIVWPMSNQKTISYKSWFGKVMGS